MVPALGSLRQEYIPKRSASEYLQLEFAPHGTALLLPTIIIKTPYECDGNNLNSDPGPVTTHGVYRSMG